MGDEAAARCMNFIVRRREDMDFWCCGRTGVLVGLDFDILGYV